MNATDGTDIFSANSFITFPSIAFSELDTNQESLVINKISFLDLNNDGFNAL